MKKLILILSLLVITMTPVFSTTVVNPWKPLLLGTNTYWRDDFSQKFAPVLTNPWWVNNGYPLTTPTVVSSINLLRHYERERQIEKSVGEAKIRTIMVVRQWNGNNTNTLGLAGSGWNYATYNYIVKNENKHVPGGSYYKTKTLRHKFYAQTSAPTVPYKVIFTELTDFWPGQNGSPVITWTSYDVSLINLMFNSDIDGLQGWIGFTFDVDATQVGAFGGYYTERIEDEAYNVGVWRFTITNPSNSVEMNRLAFVDTSPTGPWYWGWSSFSVPKSSTRTYEITVGNPNNRDGGLESLAPGKSDVDGSWQWISTGTPNVYITPM